MGWLFRTSKNPCCIWYSCDCIAVPIPMPKGKRCYRSVILLNNRVNIKWRPTSEFTHVRLLHDNAHHIHLSLWRNFSWRLPSCYIHNTPQISPNATFFLFPQFLFAIISPCKSLTQPSISALKVYLKQHTVTYFKDGFRDWNYVF